MFQKFFLFVIGICLFTHKGNSQCLIWGLATSLTATPGSCLTAPNLGAYEVTGTLSSLFSFPSTGTLTFTSDNGTSVTLNAPFGSGNSVSYTLPVKAGHGTGHTVTATFSDYSCTKQRSHSTPICCSVTVSNTTPNICEFATLTLTTTGTAGGNYFWSGPAGFSSTQQSPAIPNMLTSKAGLYQVYLVNGICTSPTSNVNVSVYTKPVPKNIVHQ